VILHVSLPDIEHGEAPLLHPGRDQPIGIAADQKADKVADTYRLLALELDEMEIAGDEILNLAFGSMVAGPKNLRRRVTAKPKRDES
jgi:hypothetical protein